MIYSSGCGPMQDMRQGTLIPSQRRQTQSAFGAARFFPFIESQTMPRPKTELTKSGKTIAVRATKSEFEEFVRLGSTRWLRAVLRASMDVKTDEKKEGKNGDDKG